MNSPSEGSAEADGKPPIFTACIKGDRVELTITNVTAGEFRACIAALWSPHITIGLSHGVIILAPAVCSSSPRLSVKLPSIRKRALAVARRCIEKLRAKSEAQRFLDAQNRKETKPVTTPPVRSVPARHERRGRTRQTRHR
jgi:hypothetical protein